MNIIQSMIFFHPNLVKIVLGYLMQSVSGPTHQKDHTPDLVLSSGFSVSNLEMIYYGVSDHFMVVEPSLSSYLPISQLHGIVQLINSAIATHFSNTFLPTQLPHISDDLPSCTDTEELLTFFNSILL